MSKNVIIGILAAVLIIGGGAYLLRDDVAEVDSTKKDDTSVTKTPSTPDSMLVAGAPIVQTSQSVAVSSSTALVTGQVNPKGTSTTYWFEYGESSSLGKMTGAQQIGSGHVVISTPAYITGLRASTLYYFRVSARNSFGTVNGSTYSFTTNTNNPPQGVAPTTRTNSASDVSRTTANVNGSVDPNGSETNFWFEYGKDNDLGNVTGVQSAGNGANSSSVSMSLSGLEPLTRYFFRLNAQNQFGTINGSILNFTTKGPAAPSAPTVTTNSASDIGTSSAQLNGRINPNGAATEYWFEYSQDSLLGSLIGGTTAKKNLDEGNNDVNVEQDVNNLSPNTKYYYRVVARNSSFGVVRGDIRSFTTRD